MCLSRRTCRRRQPGRRCFHPTVARRCNCNMRSSSCTRSFQGRRPASARNRGTAECPSPCIRRSCHRRCRCHCRRSTACWDRRDRTYPAWDPNRRNTASSPQRQTTRRQNRERIPGVSSDNLLYYLSCSMRDQLFRHERRGFVCSVLPYRRIAAQRHILLELRSLYGNVQGVSTTLKRGICGTDVRSKTSYYPQSRKASAAATTLLLRSP
jgi:hypothetical protein